MKSLWSEGVNDCMSQTISLPGSLGTEGSDDEGDFHFLPDSFLLVLCVDVTARLLPAGMHALHLKYFVSDVREGFGGP